METAGYSLDKYDPTQLKYKCNPKTITGIFNHYKYKYHHLHDTAKCPLFDQESVFNFVNDKVACLYCKTVLEETKFYEYNQLQMDYERNIYYLVCSSKCPCAPDYIMHSTCAVCSQRYIRTRYGANYKCYECDIHETKNTLHKKYREIFQEAIKTSLDVPESIVGNVLEPKGQEHVPDILPEELIRYLLEYCEHFD